MMQFRRFLLITSIFFAVFTLLITCSYGQATQWASKVVSYSSAFDQGIFFKEGLSYQHYPAQQALGKPDVLPGNSGDNPNAWVPGKSDQDAFITLGFRYPMQVQQIAIAESYHPGAVYKIFCFDEASQEHLVATLEPKPANVGSRLLNVFIDPTAYKVTAVKIVLQCGAVPGYNAIDAVAISSSPVPVYAPIHIAENLNAGLSLEPIDASADHEYINLKPVITPDGKTLFFSRKSPRNMGGRKDIEDIWYMEKDGAGQWSLPRNAGHPLNNKGHNFVSAVAPDDSSSYVLLLGNAYKKNNKMRGGVSMSKSTQEGWTQPVAMDIMDFYNYAHTAHYFLSNDRQYLVMAIERADAKGETDLYISFNRGQDNWSTPLNLGNVNTPHMESSPFMASDNTTLYFSSKGYSGFGGQDVYVTHRLDDTWQKWSEPENLGPVINSAKDDTYFNISINNDYAYLTRESLDSTQLYQMLLPIFDIPEPVYLVKGQVYNVKNNMPVAAASVVFNTMADSLNITSTTQAGSDGQFTLSLKAGQYELYAESQGYTTLNKMKVDLKALDNDGDKIIYRDLYLMDGEAIADKNSSVNLLRDLKINKEAIVSERILFDYNSYALRLTAYRHLDEVAQYLKSNPALKLQIAGHTSPEGSDAYNKKLSLERARSVAGYLAHRGVSARQLSTIGYGEEKPLFDNNIPANREKNRRVAFKITD